MLNGLALCAGAGGLELGLKLALASDYRTVAYVEREAYAAATLVARMEGERLDRAPIWDDLKTFDGWAWRGLVDVVSGGYPCQPFSAAGRRLGNGDPRHLWPDFARVIREVSPSLVFCENVDAHLRLGFAEVRGELQELGYQIEAGIFSAAEMGAPHVRKRLFFLAYSSRRSGQDGATAGAIEGRSSGEGPALADARNGLLPLAGRLPEGRDGTRSASPEFSNARGVDDSEVFAGWRLAAVEELGVARPSWPPAWDDLDGWAGSLDREPTLEPALRGVADGMASRMDRLRLAGNGVVPVVAAVAFVALWRRLNARQP